MVGLVMLAILAGAPDASDGWNLVVDSDVKVYTRSQPGARVHEIKADAVLQVTPKEFRAVLVDTEYTRKAKWIGEYRTVDHPSENVWIRYTRLDLPVVDDRDYFIEIHRDSDLADDGSGCFHSSWKPWGLELPARKGVVRVTTNTGYWDVKTAPDGVHAQVEYYLMFDPGGSIPGWAADRGNKRILPDVLHGVEQEAIRRRSEKASAQK